MARRHKPTKRRRRADWVYRGPGVDIDAPGVLTGPDTDLASYHAVQTTFSVGVSNARFLVLYDSHDRLNTLQNYVAGAAAAYVAVGAEARAEGRRARILATEGHIIMVPDTWAIGSTMSYGWRLGAFEQDPDTGLASLDADYSMFVNAAADPRIGPAKFADTKTWVREHHARRVFSTTNDQAIENIHFRWKGMRTLRANEAWGLYLEGQTGVDFRIHATWCRTLVSDEG